MSKSTIDTLRQLAADTENRFLAEDLRRAASDLDANRLLRRWILFGIGCLFAVVLFFVLVVGVISPQMNLYRKNTEKQAVISEQQSKSKAAEYAARSTVTQAEAKADAEVARARGLAESQRIIAKTLSPEYLQYLYINALADGNGQIIYVPTEAGLPVLEAGRTVADGKAGD